MESISHVCRSSMIMNNYKLYAKSTTKMQSPCNYFLTSSVSFENHVVFMEDHNARLKDLLSEALRTLRLLHKGLER